MTDDNIYAVTDQIMVKALLCLGIKPSEVTVDDRHQLKWTFLLNGKFTNQGVEHAVGDAVKNIRLGQMSQYIITLQDTWAADNFWQMNLRHRDVLLNKS